MVRAILEGRKTQTRRLVKAQPARSMFHLIQLPSGEWRDEEVSLGKSYLPGQILYVKETWKPDPSWGHTQRTKPTEIEVGTNILYKSTLPEDHPKTAWMHWRPAIFMCPWMSRIWLEVTAVRVERLQDISEEDAIAEGLSTLTKDDGKTWKWGIPDRDGLPGNDDDGWHWHEWNQDPRKAYQRLWESINGPGSWDANPFVFVYEFKRIEKP